uniref:Protein kinase domain-containing protein n=1 Tax=Panagrolaimus davidi TaxID=227884 RepID=A0A914Q8F2_9BILA
MSFNNSQTITADNDSRYSNLNLKQNLKFSKLSPVYSLSKSSSNKSFGGKQNWSFEEKGKSPLWNKFSKLSNFSILNNEIKEEERWKKEGTSNANNSIIFLHISAYENSIEAVPSDSFDNKNDNILQKKDLKQKWKNEKQIFAAASKFVIQNPFEFPRQQNDTVSKPEVSQFKTSQRLLNPNNNSKNDRRVSKTPVSEESGLYLVMEFRHHGLLLDYLRTNDGQLPQETYLRFCIEAAEALNFLHQQNILHGDICAKNFLVTIEKKLKLCNFNLADTAENIKIEELFKNVRWLPIETIKDKIFTKKSEIWSFGVLLYELYSDGKEPYPGYSGLHFRTDVLNNNCQQLQMPEKAPVAVKLLVEKCWLKTPLERPDISTILKILKDIEMRTPKNDTSIKSKESDEEEDESEGSADSYDEGKTDHQRSGSSFTDGHHGHASGTYCNNIFDNVMKDLYSIIREITPENVSDDHVPIRHPTNKTSDQDENGEAKRKEKSPRNSFYFININSNNISKKRDSYIG